MLGQTPIIVSIIRIIQSIIRRIASIILITAHITLITASIILIVQMVFMTILAIALVIGPIKQVADIITMTMMVTGLVIVIRKGVRITMLYAIFSDIHSNLQAYEACINDFKNEKVDKYYCVGDIVGYGANPIECINLTKELNCPIVCGNHDLAATGKITNDNFNSSAKEAVIWTQGELQNSDKDYLNSLPFVYNEGEFTLVHSSLYLPEEFGYVTNSDDAGLCMKQQKTKLCFIGHSHIPGIFEKTKDNQVKVTPETKIQIKENTQYLVNVGSIGQPRDGDWKACYCLYDDAKDILHFKRLKYDVNAASKAIVDVGLPKHLSERLKHGA